jgi:hypothetical protein
MENQDLRKSYHTLSSNAGVLWMDGSVLQPDFHAGSFWSLSSSSVSLAVHIHLIPKTNSVRKTLQSLLVIKQMLTGIDRTMEQKDQWNRTDGST